MTPLDYSVDIPSDLLEETIGLIEEAEDRW